MNIKEKFIFFVKKHNLISDGQKILLGVSGGPDSIAMLRLFFEFKEEFGVELAVAHINHRLRKESVNEALYVENVAESYGLDFHLREIEKGRLKKVGNSLEAAARNFRLESFEEILKKNNYDLLALAHQKNDQVETVFLNFFRGTGLNGLSGISPKSTINDINIIHPLLNITRDEVLNYCNKESLNPKFDKSNKENIYSRNIIRNKVLPLIEKEINSSIYDVIVRNANLLRKEDAFISKITEEFYRELIEKKNDNEIILSLDKLLSKNEVIIYRIIRRAYEELNHNLKDLYYDHVMDIFSLIKAEKTGKSLDLPSDIKVTISYNKIIFEKKKYDYKNKKNDFEIKVKIPGITDLNCSQKLKSEILDKDKISFSQDSNVCLCDLKKIKLPLYLRNRKPGDRFIPFGMKGSKKLKDFFIDEKVEKRIRNTISLIVDSKDEIIWVSGYRISEKVKIDETTDKILRLELIKKEE